MLSLGISEMLLIAVVGCLVVDHRKIPGTIKHVAMYYKKFQEIKTEVLDTIKGICTNGVGDSIDIDDENSSHIYGSDGKLYKRYKIRDLIKKEDRNTALISPHTASTEAFDVASNGETAGGNSGKAATSGNSDETVSSGNSGKEVCTHTNGREDGDSSCT